MNEQDLQALSAVVMTDGNLWAIMPDGQLIQMTGDGASLEFRNLRNSSLVMFHTLTNAQNWTELLISWLEVAGGEVAVDAALKIQAAISVARRIAVEGLENVAVDKK